MNNVETTSDGEVARHVLPNIVSNVAFMLINFVMGLVLVPYYLSELGVTAYAIIPVATSITSYITLISDSLSSSTSRYFSIDIHTDKTAAQSTFNTAVFGFTAIVICAIPVILAISVMVPSIFDISTNSVFSVQMLFVFILAAVLVSVWGNNFITVMYAMNRIDLMNIVKIVQVALQVVLILIFFTFVSKSVEYVGLAYLLAAIVFAIFGYLMVCHVSPDIRIRRGLFDRVRFREIATVGGWGLVNSLGNLLFIQASLLIVNIILGAEAGGYFGIVVTLISAVSALVDTLASIFAPILYQLFSERRIDVMNRVCRMAVKIVGLVMSMPIAFLCVFAAPVLTLWVGGEYAFLSDAVWATMFVMIGIGAISPAYPLTMVHLKIKIPGIITFLFGLLNVIVAVAVLEFTSYGIIGVCFTWSMTMFIKNCIVNPWYISRIAGMGTFDLHKSLLYGFVSYAFLVVLYTAIDFIINVHVTWLYMCTLGVILLAIHVVLVYRLALNSDEREVVLTCLPGPFRKIVRILG